MQIDARGLCWILRFGSSAREVFRGGDLRIVRGRREAEKGEDDTLGRVKSLLWQRGLDWRVEDGYFVLSMSLRAFARQAPTRKADKMEARLPHFPSLDGA